MCLLYKASPSKSPPDPSPPCAKGGADVIGGGIVCASVDLLFLQNESRTIPHPLRGSSLCTREPYKVCVLTRHPPLHKGGFYYVEDFAVPPFLCWGGRFVYYVISPSAGEAVVRQNLCCTLIGSSTAFFYPCKLLFLTF